MSPSPTLDEPALACLFAGHPRVDGLRALHEWAVAMDELVQLGTTQAHSVAHHKWQWWQEELQRLADGQPRHPLTRRLLAAAPEPGLWTPLAQRLELAQFELAGVAPDDEAAAERWDWRREGALQAAAMQLLGGAVLVPEAPAMALARALGRGLGRLVAVDAPGRQAGRGRLGLPLDALEAAGIPLGELPAALSDSRHAPALAAVLATELDKAQHALQIARATFDALPAGSPWRCAHTAVRLALAEQRCRRLGRRAPSPAAADVLPPWRSLWTAWTAARRASAA